MSFIGDFDSNSKVYPGVCSFMLPGKNKKDLNIEQDFTVSTCITSKKFNCYEYHCRLIALLGTLLVK